MKNIAPSDLTSADLEKALNEVTKQLKLTSNLKENNWSVFTDKGINLMHSKFTETKTQIIEELKNRGVYELIKLKNSKS